MTRADGAIAPLVSSAVGHIWLYQLTAPLRGRSPGRAVWWLQHWSLCTFRWLGLQVRVDGTPSRTPCLYVSNHRSYLDIPLLSGVLGAGFMSRADVASWRVVGTAARLIGTIFVDREDMHGRVRAARALARRLCAGSVVVFPEGTTTGELAPGPFHPGLFRLLHRLRVPVVPVTIRYSDRRAYWVDDIGMGEHLRRRVLDGSPLAASVHVGRSLVPDEHADAEALEDAVRRAVFRPIEELGELA